MAHARCNVAEAEIALVSRDLGRPMEGLRAARSTLEAFGDLANAAHAGYLEAGRLLLIGRLDEAERILHDLDAGALPMTSRVSCDLVAAGIAMRRIRARQTDQDLIQLRNYVQRASLGQQEKLPPERELAAILGVTRNRLQTSLKKLATEGLIWRHVGKGNFFGQRLQPTSGHYSVNQLNDLTNPREVMTARLAIEPALAKLAAVMRRDEISSRSADALIKWRSSKTGRIGNSWTCVCIV